MRHSSITSQTAYRQLVRGFTSFYLIRIQCWICLLNPISALNVLIWIWNHSNFLWIHLANNFGEAKLYHMQPGSVMEGDRDHWAISPLQDVFCYLHIKYQYLLFCLNQCYNIKDIKILYSCNLGSSGFVMQAVVQLLLYFFFFFKSLCTTLLVENPNCNSPISGWTSSTALSSLTWLIIHCSLLQLIIHYALLRLIIHYTHLYLNSPDVE